MTDSSVKTPSGASNAMRAEDAPIHNWYRLVLSFPPHLVAEYIDRFGLSEGQVVLDPFCGTGTTLVEAKKRGIASIGVDGLKMPAFASATKTDWDCDPGFLEHHAKHVASTARKRLEDGDFLLSLKSNEESLLLKNSISPLPLHKLLVLYRAIDSEYQFEPNSHERLALASVAVETASNLRFGPEVGVGKVKEDAPVISAWLERVRRMAADIWEQEYSEADTTVRLGDARSIDAVLPHGMVDAVITSPPYPNEKDYTRAVRLESVLLDFIRDNGDLRRVKQGLLRSNTRNVFKDDSDADWVPADSEVRQLASRIEDERIERGKTSGFERQYAKVVMEYFGGMVRHLRSLKSVVKPGAPLAYVVGDQASFFRVLIRTGTILSRLAEAEGYQVEGNDLFRTRPSTATGEQLREEVVLLRAPG